MFTREIWDRVLPDDARLKFVVGRILQMPDGELSEPWGIGSFYHAGLRWIADLNERDRFPAPPWVGSHSAMDVWSVRVRGLVYKPESEYLTAEGWGLQTRCWYVTVECGWRCHVTGETPELALKRAIVFAALARLRRDTHPDVRVHLETMCAEIGK